MIALTGDARGKRVELLRRYNIGRLRVRKKEFDRDRYLRALEIAINIAETHHPPYIAVLLDIIDGGMKSLELSLRWLEGELRSVPFPWYLAVQDGMNPEAVEEIIKTYPEIKGIFLGGTDEFKKTAPFWSSLAHRNGRLFHYARAGSMKKVILAKKALADSLDSALPLWTEEKLKRFIRALKYPAQLELFTSDFIP